MVWPRRWQCRRSWCRRPVTGARRTWWWWGGWWKWWWFWKWHRLKMRGRWRTTGDVFCLWPGLAPSICLSDNFTQASLSKRPSDWVIGWWLILCCSSREQTFEQMTLQVVCLCQAGTLVLQFLKQCHLGGTNKQTKNGCDWHTRALYGQS